MNGTPSPPLFQQEEIFSLSDVVSSVAPFWYPIFPFSSPFFLFPPHIFGA